MGAKDYSHIPTTSGITAWFDKRNASFRGWILLGACFLTFGSYYCYDIVGALSPVLIDPFYGVTTTQESFLYAVYSLPNTVLPFFGGLLVDRILGVRFGGILFGGLVLAGQLIWAFSAVSPDIIGFYIAVFGRFIFGLGGESLSVTQSAYCGKWFPEEFLTIAFGITLAFARIGSAINFLITPFLGGVSFSLALWFGAACCLVSMFFAIQLAFWDWRAEKIIPPEKTEAEVIRLSDVLHFKYTLWMLIAVCVFFYISIFVFLQNAVAFFFTDYGLSTSRGGIITSIPYFVAAFAAPTAGLIISRTGYTLTWLAAACGLNGFTMLSLLWLKFIPPIIPMFFVGLSYSVVAASLWPCLPLIVKPWELGTAYGLFFAIQNSGLFVSPIIIGKITSTGYYTSMMLSFAGCAFCACFITISVMICDKIEGGNVNLSAKEMAARKERLSTEDKLSLKSINADETPGVFDYDD